MSICLRMFRYLHEGSVAFVGGRGGHTSVRGLERAGLSEGHPESATSHVGKDKFKVVCTLGVGVYMVWDVGIGLGIWGF